ncbi:MAG TPA: hypothetical protein VIE46_10440 [Gemmatimonadales bacterium]|jgi:hypothetical protein
MPANRYLALALSGLAAITACNGSAGTAPGAQAQLSLNVASRPRAGAGSSARSVSLDVTSPTPGTFTDGTNTLVLTSVQVVLRKIELERVGHDGACAANSTMSASTNASSGGGAASTSTADDHGHDMGDDNGNDANDDCENVEVGPVLVDVPVTTSGAQHSVSVTVDAGTFEKVEFEIHQPENDTGDLAFLAANPGFAGISIRVQGTWNGTSFTFTSDLNAKQEIELSPPLVVAQSGATDLTIFFGVSGWFATSGGTLIDPASAVKGQPNEGLVQDNIKRSLRAFRDNDEDGAED